MNKDTFLGKDYEQPNIAPSGYMKLQEGINKFRVLSSAITGYEYWTVGNKPVRSKEPFEGVPKDARLNDGGQFRPKHFWAFVVWNYKENAVQILEITQATIQDSMLSLVRSEEWGDPKEYDITIRREGEKLDTSYTVHPSPKKDIPQDAIDAYEGMGIELEALYTGDNPFKGTSLV